MDPDPSSSLTLLLAAVEHAPIVLGTGGVILVVGVLLTLLLISGFVSGSEVALFSLTATDRDDLAERADAASQRVAYLLEQPRRLLVTILFVNNFVNVGAAVLAALLTVQAALAFGWTEALVFLIETVVLTYLLLVVSEITPKLIAARRPIQYSRFCAGPLLLVFKALYPVSSLFARWMSGLQRRIRPSSPDVISTEDLKALADVGAQHGSLEKQERELIYSIVEFGETSVREIMASRLDMVALSQGATLGEAFDTIRESGHSRLPLYEDHLDNVLGVVYAKDLMAYLPENPDTTPLQWRDIARPAMFVPQSKKLDDLLRDFQQRKTHIAIVVDEYGGTAGLVTMEDVLEEIVGEIRDEYDSDETALVEKVDVDTYRVDARIDLDDLNKHLGIELETDAYDFETLGGLVYNLAGMIPEAGDTFEHGGLEITVEALENHRISFARVRVPLPAPEREQTD